MITLRGSWLGAVFAAVVFVWVPSPLMAGAVATPAAESPSLREFLISTPNTYGWEPEKGTLSYDFFANGALHIQGPDGEATMWQGRWKLDGDQLTLTNTDIRKTQVVTVLRKGDAIWLDGKKYRRYRPVDSK